MIEDNSQRTVLLVDDEENILSALIRLFRRDGYHILKASSGKQGLELLAEHDVGVVISDQRMPHMTGVEFLSTVRALYPDKICMVLSGYTDLESVIDAINRGAVYKFLLKPWDDELLRRNLKEAFEQYELKRENERLNQALKHANEELGKLNRDLERRVELKTREVMIHAKMLQVSQDVLEKLPVAVLGMGDDGIIRVANDTAQQWFGDDIDDLVGAFASEVLAVAVDDLCNDAIPGPSFRRDVELGQGDTADLYCSRLEQSSGVQGWALVLTCPARVVAQ